MTSKGPIPEGTYHLQQLDHQRISELLRAKRCFSSAIGILGGVAANQFGAIIEFGCIRRSAPKPLGVVGSRLTVAPF